MLGLSKLYLGTVPLPVTCGLAVTGCDEVLETWRGCGAFSLAVLLFEELAGSDKTFVAFCVVVCCPV